MGPLKIPAEEFVKDVESDMDDSSLMSKYGLNPDLLQMAFRQLLDMGLISHELLAGWIFAGEKDALSRTDGVFSQR